MNILTKLRHALLGKPHEKITRLPPTDGGGLRIDELPPFSLAIAERMRYDPQVRIGLGARNGLLMAAEVEVTGPDEPLVRWVQRQWDSLWHGSAHQLLRAKLFGFMPFEVEYRRVAAGEFAGLVEVARLIDYHPRHARLLIQGEEIVGFSYEEQEKWSDRPGRTSAAEGYESAEYGHSPAQDFSSGHVRRGPSDHFKEDHHSYLSPLALVCTFDAECDNAYGCPLLARAYPSWHEKWKAGGAKRTLQLRMMKDGYLGDILWYPPNETVEQPDGSELSWADVARQIVAARHSGGALVLPSIYDSAGNKLVDYTPPQDVRGATQIFRWKADLDLEIWKALEVPPEIIQASTTGSGFSGRWIPFAVALSAVHQELAELIRCVDRDVLRPIAQLNFGRVPQYEIRAKNLVDTYAAKFGTSTPTQARSASEG